MATHTGFELASIRLEGLDCIEAVDLDQLSRVTTLIGVNGAGKSTLLRGIHLALQIVATATASDVLPTPIEPWVTFKSARLRFVAKNPVSLGPLELWLGPPSADLVLTITVSERKRFTLALASGEFALDFAAAPTRTLRNAAADRKRAAAEHLDNLRAQSAIATRDATLPGRIQTAAHELGLRVDEVKKLSTFQATMRDGTTAPIECSNADDTIEGLSLPGVLLMKTGSLSDVSIENFITHLVDLSKGDRNDKRQYDALTERMSRLLQAEVDPSEKKGERRLRINGTDYQHVSNGTRVTLDFLAMTEQTSRGTVVLWDEPENGLHPTRRCRVLDLMRADDRQFVLATHATEFAPVLHDDVSRVFRCDDEYLSDDRAIKVHVSPVEDRRGAFAVAEAIGLHPARALFTANVVVWIEGPSELLFYRRWLTPILNESKVFEGLHYSIVPYGGALLTYAEIADDPTLSSLVDILGVSRHAVVLLDADFHEAPSAPAYLSLKKGAQRIHHEVERLNSDRRDAVMMSWTTGREIENYLPPTAVAHAVHHVWKESTADDVANLDLSSLRIDRYENVFEKLDARFIERGIVSTGKDGRARGKGYTRWTDKVSMMEAALATPGLTEADLLHGAGAELTRIREFIKAHADLGDR